MQIGLRGSWPFPEEFDWMREQGFRWHTIGEIDDRGLRAVLDDAIAHVRSARPRTYLTVDIDVASIRPSRPARARPSRAG